MSHALSDALAMAGVVLGRVLGGQSATRALAEVPATGGLRAAVQALAYSALRDYGHADAILRELVARPPAASLQGLLVVALVELERGGREAHAVVHQAVEAAARVAPRSADRSKSLVNGVLRNAVRRRDELRARVLATESGRYRHPQWWIERVRKAWPAHWESILAAGNAEPPMMLRVDRRRATGAEYLEQCRKVGISGVLLGEQAIRLTGHVGVERLPGFGDGLVSVQDLAAQQAALLLDVRPGMRVLDACAAPGGKTAHIAELVDCDLTAVDNDDTRLARVRENLARLQLAAKVVCADAAAPVNKSANAKTGDPIGEGFDRILLDAPCSASGVVRRHPDIKWLRRESDFAALRRTQAALLGALWPRLAAGGVMLYATCSVFPEENRERTAEFLRLHDDAELMPIHLPMMGESAPGEALSDEEAGQRKVDRTAANAPAVDAPAIGAPSVLSTTAIADNILSAAAPHAAGGLPAGCQILPGGDTDGFYFAMLRKKPA